MFTLHAEQQDKQIMVKSSSFSLGCQDGIILTISIMIFSFGV